jgi:hypothetical protein
LKQFSGLRDRHGCDGKADWYETEAEDRFSEGMLEITKGWGLRFAILKQPLSKDYLLILKKESVLMRK